MKQNNLTCNKSITILTILPRRGKEKWNNKLKQRNTRKRRKLEYSIIHGQVACSCLPLELNLNS